MQIYDYISKHNRISITNGNLFPLLMEINIPLSMVFGGDRPKISLYFISTRLKWENPSMYCFKNKLGHFPLKSRSRLASKSRLLSHVIFQMVRYWIEKGCIVFRFPALSGSRPRTYTLFHWCCLLRLFTAIHVKNVLFYNVFSVIHVKTHAFWIFFSVIPEMIRFMSLLAEDVNLLLEADDVFLAVLCYEFPLQMETYFHCQ